MACRLFGAKPLPEPMLAYCQLDSLEQISMKFESWFYHFHSRKCIWKYRLPKWRPSCPGGDELIVAVLNLLQEIQDISTLFIISQNWHVAGRSTASSWKTRIHAPCIINIHDDVIKWKTFPRYWPFVRGIHRLAVNSPHKGQWRRALMFSLICAWINGWANNRKDDDLRRHRVHYDVIVMHKNWHPDDTRS